MHTDFSNVSFRVEASADGSDTVFITGTRLGFHSAKGAVTESKVVFIENGIGYYLGQHNVAEINILELGFGTGLNALLAAVKAVQMQRKINYTSVDLYPLPLPVLRQLNYGGYTGRPELYEQVAAAGWDTLTQVSPFFTLRKIKTDILAFEPLKEFNICFFDAFAPGDQPELWSEAVFRKIKSGLLPGGVLTTYCSKSTVRKTLESVGFTVQKLKGPPGKREVIRALVNS